MPERTRSTEEFWESLYGASERIWSGRPNAHLVTVAGPLCVGTALDLGCGEGGDAVWLAERGWRVTAVDVSPTALARLAARAAESGLAITTERHDLTETFPEGRFDLVSAQFLQSPLEFARDAVLRRAARAVAPGGLLLVVAHQTAPPWSPARPGGGHGEGHGHGEGQGHGHGHGHGPGFPTAAETLEALRADPGWDDALWVVEQADAREREVVGPDGETATVLDSVLAVRRAP
jgi:SAM-dependent methyltransferase